MTRRKVAFGLVVLMVALGGFLLWGRGLATPVGAAEAGRRYLVAPDDPTAPGPRPPAGVYRYRTSGHEQVDRVAIDHTYPAETVRVISWRGGCRWRETVPIFDQHVETYDFCSQDGDARDYAVSTRLTYFLVPYVQRLACAPLGRRLLAGARPGTTVSWRCVEGASVSWNTTTYVGSETVATGAGPATARHVRLVMGLSGRSTGGAVRDLWLNRHGLVLKEERQVLLRVRSGFVGVLTYRERASFVLAALNLPARMELAPGARGGDRPDMGWSSALARVPRRPVAS